MMFFINPLLELEGVSIKLASETKLPLDGLIYEFKVLIVKSFDTFSLLSSFDKIQNIIRPVIIKPTLLKALIGSRKILELTLSHQRATSPTDTLGSQVTINPSLANT